MQRWASMFANKYTKLFGNAPAGATTPRPSKEELLQMEFEDLLSLMKAFGCFGHSNTTADARKKWTVLNLLALLVQKYEY